MPFNNGEVFAGYIIQRLLGTGGTGEVYLAQHPRLPRHDALKILSLASTVDEEFRARFIREAELAATLWHPHIVGVLDRGEFNGLLWISMDYVDGTDAGRLVRERHPRGMPEEDVWEIVTAVADALDFGHDRRLLHRDVKPENILVTAADGHRRRVLLTDFGIARRIDDVSNLTDANVAIGRRPSGSICAGCHDVSPTNWRPTFSRLKSRCRSQPPSQYATTTDIAAPTRSRAPGRRAGKGAGQRPERAVPELRRLCSSPHAAGSRPRCRCTVSAIRLTDVGAGPRRGPRFRRTSTHGASRASGR
jgi:serine/threonine protein kinase